MAFVAGSCIIVLFCFLFVLILHTTKSWRGGNFFGCLWWRWQYSETMMVHLRLFFVGKRCREMVLLISPCPIWRWGWRIVMLDNKLCLISVVEFQRRSHVDRGTREGKEVVGTDLSKRKVLQCSVNILMRMRWWLLWRWGFYAALGDTTAKSKQEKCVLVLDMVLSKREELAARRDNVPTNCHHAANWNPIFFPM